MATTLFFRSLSNSDKLMGLDFERSQLRMPIVRSETLIKSGSTSKLQFVTLCWQWWMMSLVVVLRMLSHRTCCKCWMNPLEPDDVERHKTSTIFNTQIKKRASVTNHVLHDRDDWVLKQARLFPTWTVGKGCHSKLFAQILPFFFYSLSNE